MRLTSIEKKAFLEVLADYINTPYQLRLFGSRIDDTAKGGDIDLLIIVENNSVKEELLYHKAEILGKIKTIIGDQKIDLLITSENSISNSAFLKTVFGESIKIN